MPGKLFLQQRLKLTGAEISFNHLAPGDAMPFYHKHKHSEEIYLFIKGVGEFQVDGQSFAVAQGSAVRVNPQGLRCWRNTGTEPLYYIVIQVKANSYQHGSTIEDGEAVDQEVRWNS